MGYLKKRKQKKLRAKYDEKHVELPAEVKYKADMETFLGRFSTEGLPKEVKHDFMAEAMEQKHSLDQRAIAEKFPGFVIVQHVLETRHGESGAKEKMGGLSPNADLSERQVEGIKKAETNQYTHYLLGNPENGVTVISSTMLRAKRTALLMMSASVKKLSFSLNKQFTEEGKYASSAAYTSTSGTKTGWGKFIGFVKPSILRQRHSQSAEVDQGIRDRIGATGDLHDSYNRNPQYQSIPKAPPMEQKNEETVSNLPVDKKKKGQTISSPTVDESEPDITFLSKGDKVAAINNSIINHIEQNEKKDLAVFFHGGIGKEIYKQRYGLEYRWDYLATKETYFLKGPDGKIIEYSPPGAVRVGVDGEFTGVFKKNERALVSADFDRVQMLKDAQVALDNKLKALRELANELKELKGADPEILRTNATKLYELKALEPHTVVGTAENKEVTKEINRISTVVEAELNKTSILEAKTAKLNDMILDINAHKAAIKNNIVICNKEESVKTEKIVNKIRGKKTMFKSKKEKKISEVWDKYKAQSDKRLSDGQKQDTASKGRIDDAQKILSSSKTKLEAQKQNDKQIMKQAENNINAPEQAPKPEPRRMGR